MQILHRRRDWNIEWDDAPWFLLAIAGFAAMVFAKPYTNGGVFGLVLGWVKLVENRIERRIARLEHELASLPRTV